jgi:hypothetical protein
MAALPGCEREGKTAAAAAPNQAAATCGAWLTMRRTAEYDKKLRLVEDAAAAAPGQAPALPQPALIHAQ